MHRAIPAALAALVLSSSPAFDAVAPAQSKGKGKDKKKVVAVDGKDKDHRPDVIVFSDRDRDAWRSYWVGKYGQGKCPPGLDKKDNGCLPPGRAKKRYVVGQKLPIAVVVRPLPEVFVTQIGPPPAGYKYVMVDNDVVKLAVGTRMVVDALTAIVD